MERSWVLPTSLAQQLENQDAITQKTQQQETHEPQRLESSSVRMSPWSNTSIPNRGLSVKKRKRHNTRHPPLLLLPPELRQIILALSISPSDLTHITNINRRCRTRSRICRLLDADLHVVRRVWLAQRKQIHESGLNRPKTWSELFVAEFLAPVQAAAKALKSWPAARRKAEIGARRYEARLRRKGGGKERRRAVMCGMGYGHGVVKGMEGWGDG
ncbi:hypothetical protein LTR62_006854 [Meristemomyces frigidus]|uniref:Uncharacterized protein n=1 Tax=Meristemomyces frigidus TaxID=1508187 RepID=A0AAN7TBP1_9PEZI|nr:hypothetical protein LTR62_006854 [Meristemomyces frigidus]